MKIVVLEGSPNKNGSSNWCGADLSRILQDWIKKPFT